MSSSGCARNASTLYTITPITSEKIAMQITVANQYVNVIRSISSDAECGSQRISTATRVVTTAAAAAIASIFSSALLRATRRDTTNVAGAPIPPPDRPSRPCRTGFGRALSFAPAGR